MAKWRETWKPGKTRNVSSFLDLLCHRPGSILSGHLDNAVSSVCTEMA